MANVAWVVVFVLFALARAVLPILVVLTPLLALPSAVLMRMAVVAARQGTPRWSLAGSELWRLAGRKVALGALQLLILLLAITNILVSGEIDGLPGALSTLVAG